jgi:hypothetical protein
MHRSQGEYAEAVRYLERAAGSQRRLFALFVVHAPEAEALAYARAQPQIRDQLLSALRHVPNSDERAYAAVWGTKAMITQILEARHTSARVVITRSKEVQKQWQDLVAVRRSLARLLVLSPDSIEQTDESVARLTQQKERLERELARALPEVSRAEELRKLGPRDLAKKLPDGTVFVDFLRCQDSEKAGAPVPSYVAFVVSGRAPPRRIDLGPAKPIDAAVKNADGSRSESACSRLLFRSGFLSIVKSRAARCEVVFRRTACVK